MLKEPWHITLCGGLRARHGEKTVSRFRTQKTGLLLAYLALYSDRKHGREELAELFWHDSDTPLPNLRVSLMSLRHQLEPPGVRIREVLVTDRTHVGLAPGAVRTDVAEFYAALADAASLSDPQKKAEALQRGVAAVSGELLPGSYLDWVLQAREILSERLQGALKELVTLLTVQKETETALLYALRRTHLNPLNEEAHLSVMQLLLQLHRPADAVQHFQRLTALLEEELGVTPARPLCDLATVAAASANPASPGRSSSAKPADAPAEDSFPPRAAVPMVAPPLPSVRLPLTLTPFFGRAKELRRLFSQLAPSSRADTSSESDPACSWKPRVVTLLGSGGSGKTRLAIEAARACAAKNSLTVCFVALANADTRERMLQLIAEAIAPKAPADSTPLETITSTLRSVPTLLILDNMEQLVEEGAEAVNDLLGLLPHLILLVTSRRRLGLHGERELALAPLPTPDQGDTPECLLEFASVQLFVDRAQAACADFQLTERNAASVAALCHRLEGLPLALELAASWAQTLSPAQMLARLDQRFELLRARRKGMATRHQTLEMCIDWSFQLLPPDVQTFFCRLCLLRGDWTLETADIIAAEGAALDKVQCLREASFLLAREVVQAEETILRFHMLESLREFGLKKLSADAIDTGYERLTQHLIAAPNTEALALIHVENIRLAVHWCQRSVVGAKWELSLLTAIKDIWFQRGGWIEGRNWLQDALRRHHDEDLRAYRQVWNLLGSLHWMLRETLEAEHCFREALAAAEHAGDDALAARVLNNLGMTATQRGDFVEAYRLGEQSLRFAESLGDERLVAALLNNVGSAHMALGQYETARGYLEQSLHKSREQGRQGMVAMCLTNLAGIARSQGGGEAARKMYQESIEICRTVEDHRSLAETLQLLADLLHEQGEVDQARLLTEESKVLWERLAGELQ